MIKWFRVDGTQTTSAAWLPQFMNKNISCDKHSEDCDANKKDPWLSVLDAFHDLTWMLRSTSPSFNSLGVDIYTGEEMGINEILLRSQQVVGNHRSCYLYLGI